MPPPPPERKGKGNQSPTLERLAKPTERVEYLDTPGPYTYADNRDNRKIPYVFRTSERFPKSDQPMRDRLECDRSATEPRPVHVVFSTDSRFPTTKVATSDASKYDVEKGLQLIEKRAFAATFGSKRKDMELPVHPDNQRPLTLTSEHYLTIAHTPINGGAMSHEERNTLESFILHTESPGPIYNPSYSQVQADPVKGVFSSQRRMPTQKFETPSPLAYADAVHQTQHLSVYRRPPTCIIGDVPKVMPLPFTVHNMCNSRSMRTMLCRPLESRDGDSTTSPNRSNGQRRPSTGCSLRRSPPRRTSQSPSVRPESALRWIERIHTVRAQSADPRRYVLADSPFSTIHHVPTAVRTLVLSTSGTENDEAESLEEPSQLHRRTSNRSVESPLPSAAVERLRTLQRKGREKRRDLQGEPRSAEGSRSPSPDRNQRVASPASGDPHNGVPPSSIPYRYEPKYPHVYADEGYMSVQFSDAVKKHLDDHRPLEEKKVVPQGRHRWQSAS